MAWRAVLGLALLGLGGAALASESDARRAQLEVAAGAESVIADKIAPRRERLRARLGALYRASRDELERGLFDRRSRWRRARARADLIRIVRRDLSELRALERELELVRRARQELEAAPPPEPEVPEPLLRPVAGAAEVEGPAGFAALAVEPGAAVRAPAAGAIVFRGEVAGLGTGVIVESEGRWILLGPLELEVEGSRVERGEPLGRAAGERLLLEVRRVDSRGGTRVELGEMED